VSLQVIRNLISPLREIISSRGAKQLSVLPKCRL